MPPATILRRDRQGAIILKAGETSNGKRTMPNVLVREIDERDLDLLKRRAQASGRSLQAELKRILELAARAADHEAALALAEQVTVALSGRTHPDSARLIRADRDR